eukprot:1005451-Pyramimonas_sp.AAC.1
MGKPTDWAKLTIPALKEELKRRGLTVSGKKAELVARLTSLVANINAVDGTPASPTAAPETPAKSPPPNVKARGNVKRGAADVGAVEEGAGAAGVTSAKKARGASRRTL